MSTPDFLPGFATHRIETESAVFIHARSAGHGPPERLIGAETAFFLGRQLHTQSRTEGVPSAALAAEYLRCYSAPGTIHSACEDYRAAASIDLGHDRADDAARRRIGAPLLALWGDKGTVGALYDVPQTWREKTASPDLVTGAALPCGHLLQEEQPDALLAHLLAFLAG
ncbi:hypothetical protein [Lichenicoccus sp.]|uniref:hypothetical protein n=1 Tax=Lichenicoccus sp. TaxID=2781899 RepID=UPI003D10C2DF